MPQDTTVRVLGIFHGDKEKAEERLEEEAKRMIDQMVTPSGSLAARHTLGNHTDPSDSVLKSLFSHPTCSSCAHWVTFPNEHPFGECTALGETPFGASFYMDNEPYTCGVLRTREDHYCAEWEGQG